MRRLSAAMLPLLVVACGDGAVHGRPAAAPVVEPATGAADPVAARVLHPASLDPTLAVEVVASGLSVPWAVDFAPDGRIFVAERPGRIRVIEGGMLRAEPWAELPAYHDEWAPEAGLMGLTLAPDFDETGHVFVMVTVSTLTGNRATVLARRAYRKVAARLRLPARSTWETHIYRFTDRDGSGSSRHTVVARLPSYRYHAGGALQFGPDGHLYVSVGDAFEPEAAQDPESSAGRILRFTRDGDIPADNPVPGSATWAFGLRNAQGLAWHPRTGDLFATDHGKRHQDELNHIQPGGNYGWPVAAGMSGSTFIDPVLEWTPGIAPSGLAFYSGDALPWDGDLFVAGLAGLQLRRVVLDRAAAGDGWRATHQEPVILDDLGRIRAVRTGPDGFLYFTTSNRDGRGAPTADDDRLLRIVPATGPRPDSDAATNDS